MTADVLHIYEFGAAVLNERDQTLKIQGLLVDLQPQSWRLLLALVKHEGGLIAKAELESAVWRGRYVGENVLAAAVTRLRHALGETLQGLIEAVPKRGYRLSLPVTKKPLHAEESPILTLAPGEPMPGWGEYQLLKKLSEGPSGEVWLAGLQADGDALHAALQSGAFWPDSTKVFKVAQQPAAVSALQREVSLLRGLRQSVPEPDRLVALTHWQFGEGLNAMGMDWAGLPLDEWWARDGRGDALDLAARRALMIDLVAAVAQAHALGVVHRDLKPSNVLVRDTPQGWQLRLCDFGTARSLDPELWSGVDLSTLTADQTRALMQDEQGGTLFYMAPECLQGHPSSERSDVYALGLLICQIWTGKFGQPLLVGWEREICDQELRADIASCTDGDLTQRLEHAGALLRRLQQHAQRREAREKAQLAQLQQEALSEALRRQRARRPWMLAALVTLVAGLLATGVAYWRLQQSQELLAQETRDLRALNQFYAQDFLASSDPQGAGRFKVTVEAALERATQLLEAEGAPYSPKVKALVHGQLLDAYLDAGWLEQAVIHGERALALSRQQVERDFEQERTVALSLAKADVKLGHLERATRMLDEIEAQQAVAGWSARQAVYFWARRAEVASAQARSDLAIGYYRQGASVLATMGPQDAAFKRRNMLAIRSGLAEAMRAHGDPQGAVRELEQLLEEVQALKSSNDMKYCILLVLQSNSLRDAGEWARSLRAAEAALVCVSAAGGKETFWDGQAYRALGMTQWRLSRLDQARESLDKGAAIILKTRGQDSHVTLSAQEDAALLRLEMGEPSQAHEMLEALLAKAQQAMGPKAPIVHHVRHSLVLAKLALGQRQGLKSLLEGLDPVLLRNAQTDEAWPLRLAMAQARTAMLFGETAQAAEAWRQARQARTGLTKMKAELQPAYDELARHLGS